MSSRDGLDYQLGPTMFRHVLARLGRVGGVDARRDAARHDGARVRDEPLGLCTYIHEDDCRGVSSNTLRNEAYRIES